ncbi:fibrinolytic enzyme, isozyme C-like [Physella acuta]|uniref:fibrinolytic enzyme, isozyme C-like n=1 Tax=Physella acuta TaxID=109671 RepID=UPI0027DC7D01|nr:fibrinolytic enzyme, isozyme C-like [Physella acuta]
MRTYDDGMLGHFSTSLGDPVAGEHKASRIVHGTPSVPGARPYQVSFQVNSKGVWRHICGGTLVTLNKIVTAAHCAVAYPQLPWRVELGTVVKYDETNPYRQAINVSSYVVHEDYSPLDNLPNDIAILTLVQNAELSPYVLPAILPVTGEDFLDKPCILSGFGNTNWTSGGSPILRETTSRVIANDDCTNYYQTIPEDPSPDEHVGDGHICMFDLSKPAGERPGVCFGDSGSPALCEGAFNIKYFAGIASWIHACDASVSTS